ncbi:MAG: hypothetical protein IKI15_01955 [Lachnospiraceae bacterium]|nr:hypothetical protein [Lachnospiraceae bacterium]
MGLGYKGGADHHHVISENLGPTEDRFPVNNGYFGQPGESSDNSVRHIESNNPIDTAKEFYDQIAYGSDEHAIYDKNGNEKGLIAKLADGTCITYREKSNSDGSPAVSISIRESTNPAGIKNQKIHFTIRR